MFIEVCVYFNLHSIKVHDTTKIKQHKDNKRGLNKQKLFRTK